MVVKRIDRRKRDRPEYQRVFQKQWRVKNPEAYLLQLAKARAKRKGLAFEIDITDIVIPEFCPILLIPIFSGIRGKSNNSPSLDRVDNTKGYIKGNVRVISNRANQMKSSLSLEEVGRLVEYMKCT